MARRLAGRFPRSVHIEGDLVGHHFIVNGLVPPRGPPPDEAQAQLRLRRRNICLLADSFAEAGFTVVIDDVVVSRSVLDLYLSLLTTRPLSLVQLAPRLEVVARRDANRDKQVFEIWSHLDAELRREMPGIGLWLGRMIPPHPTKRGRVWVTGGSRCGRGCREHGGRGHRGGGTRPPRSSGIP